MTPSCKWAVAKTAGFVWIRNNSLSIVLHAAEKNWLELFLLKGYFSTMAEKEKEIYMQKTWQSINTANVRYALIN